MDYGMVGTVALPVFARDGRGFGLGRKLGSADWIMAGAGTTLLGCWRSGRVDHVGKEGRHGYKESILLGWGI